VALPLNLESVPEVLGLPGMDLQVDVSLSSRRPQSDAPVPVSDVTNSIAAGLAYSPEVTLARATMRTAAARSQIARGALLPRLDLRRAQGSGNYASGSTEFEAPWATRSEGSLELRQPVYNPAAVAEYRRQQSLKTVSELDLAAKQSSVALDNGLAFLAVLLSQGRLELTQEYARSLDELLGYIQRRTVGGLSSDNEQNRVESRVVAAQAALSESQANLRAALSNFVRLAGFLPRAVSFKTDLSRVPTDIDAVRLMDMVQDNPELRSALKQLEALRFAKAGSESAYRPKVELNVATSRNENVGSISTSQIENKMLLVLTYNLFAGGADRAAIYESIGKVDEQDARVDQLTRELRNDVETTLAGLETFGARFASMQRQVKLDSGVVENFKEQLLTGNRQLLDVLDAYQRLFQSRSDLLSIAVTEAQATLRLNFLTGRLVLAERDAP
jgi:adhesin transport system outer membrane protein